MRLNLQCHPTRPVSPLDGITVEWSMSRSGTIWLRYHVSGNVEQVKLPDDQNQFERRDNLWENTCFELFLSEPDTEQYCEFNFSPSGNWAAYSFRRYREEMVPLALTLAPEIFMDFSESHVALEVTFGLPDVWIEKALDASLSAIIETQNGEKSFWALAHSAAKPDFHHRDGFRLKMEAAER